jgi:hypothetical protein
LRAESDFLKEMSRTKPMRRMALVQNIFGGQNEVLKKD